MLFLIKIKLNSAKIEINPEKLLQNFSSRS